MTKLREELSLFLKIFFYRASTKASNFETDKNQTRGQPLTLPKRTTATGARR